MQNVNLKEIVEELNFELSEKFPKETITWLEYSTNTWSENVSFKLFPILDSENYDLNDDDGYQNKTGIQKALEILSETFKTMQVELHQLEKIVNEKLESHKPKLLLETLGETDLDKPDQFDNKRFEGE